MGLERAPEGLNMLYQGHSKGKVLVKVADLHDSPGAGAQWLWGTAPRAVGRVHPSTMWSDSPTFAGNELHRWAK